MESKEELQRLINDIRPQLPKDTTIELIDLDESAQADEPQSEPGPALPDEMLSMIAEAAEEIMKAIESGEMPDGAMHISALDDSDESRQAMASLSSRVGALRKSKCYHYILDKQGNPVHCEDREEVVRFECSGKHVLATKYFDCQGLKMVVQTGLVIHNPMINNEPPAPHWVTVLARKDTGEIGRYTLAHSAEEAMENHRFYCKGMHHSIAAMHRDRRPSNVRRAKALKRIAAGQDVLRRTLKEAFGDMAGPEIARVLGLSDMRRKRGQQ